MSTRIVIDGADFTVNGIDIMTNAEKVALVVDQMANAKWIDKAINGAQAIGKPIDLNHSTFRSCVMIPANKVYKERDIVRNTSAGDGYYCLAIPKGCTNIALSTTYEGLNFSMLIFDENANLLRDTGWKTGGTSYTLDTSAWMNEIFYVGLNMSNLIPSGETLTSIGYSLTASFS
jgi:hypothetical protein